MATRALNGLRASIAVSDSATSSALGFPGWQVNHITVQIVSALIGQGAAAAFGHDWRDDGVMEAIHGFAVQMVEQLSPAEEAGNRGAPLIWNIVPWPDKPTMSAESVDRLAGTLRIEEIALPIELRQHDSEKARDDKTSALYKYIRARSLTTLRRRLTKVSDCRICLGGRTRGFQGRYPGVFEEGLLAVEDGKPLFVAGLFGGAARLVIDAIEGREMPPAFGQENASLLRQAPMVEADPVTELDRRFDPEGAWGFLAEKGRYLVDRSNGLSADENHELFETLSVERVIELVLTGIGRLKRREAG